jgi:cytochrome c2
VVFVALALCLGCTRQGGMFSSREGSPPPVDLADWGRSVFRFETFGNERFWSDTLGLAEGLARRKITPNGLLALGVQFDGDKVPSDFRRSDVGIGPYTDPRATRRLLDANAVIGLVARGERIGVTCALCHSRADDRIGDGVGRRLDGLPNTRLKVGALIAWGERSRAYLPFLNLVGLGRGPRVDPAASPPDDPLASARLERDVDAALRAWPAGQSDVVPDGVGNPTDIMPVFNLVDVGPYNRDGFFQEAADAHNHFFSVVLDPTTLVATDGTAFLSMGAPIAWEGTLQGAYDALLSAIDPAMAKPRVTAERSGALGFRVSGEDLGALNAYLARRLPPPAAADEQAIDAGRRVFREAGCNECHLESPKTTGAIVPLGELATGYAPKRVDRAIAFGGVLQDDPDTAYDDRLIVMNAEWRRGKKGYKVPQLLGVALTAPYLHDGSVPTLKALFSPDRGLRAPHPYYVVHPDERADLVAFLRAWDGREYP